ncbi:MAG: hypothetical protein SPF70_01390 [Lachnospiraceae bacterium]|nr:hypothetical protein [Lachnospiraceae bacterium]
MKVCERGNRMNYNTTGEVLKLYKSLGTQEYISISGDLRTRLF